MSLLRTLYLVLFASLTTAVNAVTLEEQKAAFDERLAAIDTAFMDRLANLNGGYRHALGKLQAKFQSEGNLEHTLAVKAELDLFNAAPEEGANSGSKIPELADLQKKYATAQAKFIADLEAKQAELLRAHLAALTKIQSELTKANKLEEAIALRDEIDAWKKTPLGQLAAKPPATPGAGPPKRSGMPEDYALYYSFDERQENGSVIDKSKNELHGTTQVNAWIEKGKKGGGFDFTERESIMVQHNPIFFPEEGITIAAWVNLKDSSSYGRIWDKYEPFRRTGYGFNVDRFRPVLDVWNAEGDRDQIKSDQALSVGEWNHVAVTVEPGEAILYINGKEVKKERFGKGVRGNESPVRIGLDEFRALKGHMDELLFYTRALDSREIDQVVKETGGGR